MVERELKETRQEQAPAIDESVLQVLRLWRGNTAYRWDEDWIFASPHYHGKTPYTIKFSSDDTFVPLSRELLE